MKHTHIYIDGIDGAGKTTLVATLRKSGFTNIHDRSILTKMSIVPISELPDKIPSNIFILKQFETIKKCYRTSELCTNRDTMNKLIIYQNTSELSTDDEVIYVILDADAEVALQRFAVRPEQINAWDCEASIRYFKSKYLYIAHKYKIPIIDTSKLTPNEVYDAFINLVSNYDKFTYPTINNDHTFNMDLLELEWLNLGDSKIIYADTKHYVSKDGTAFDIQTYQQEIAKKLAKKNLSNFINQFQR